MKKLISLFLSFCLLINVPLYCVSADLMRERANANIVKRDSNLEDKIHKKITKEIEEQLKTHPDDFNIKVNVKNISRDPNIIDRVLSKKRAEGYQARKKFVTGDGHYSWDYWDVYVSWYEPTPTPTITLTPEPTQIITPFPTPTPSPYVYAEPNYVQEYATTDGTETLAVGAITLILIGVLAVAFSDNAKKKDAEGK